MSKYNKSMENKKEILVITQLLTKLRIQKKMVEFNLNNRNNLTQKQIDSHLDEKLRIDKSIKILEKQLKRLED